MFKCQSSAFFQRTEEIFAIPMPKYLRSILDYLEYLLILDFGMKNSQSDVKKTQKNMLSEIFVMNFQKMHKKYRLSYYMLISQYAIMLMHGKKYNRLKPTEDYEGIVYIREKSSQNWNQDKIKLNYKTHFLEIGNGSNIDNTLYNLSQYLFRESSNEKYNIIVLSAIDRRIEKKKRSLHIGLESKYFFQDFKAKIQSSIELCLWQFVQFIYKSDPLTKNSINSIKNNSFDYWEKNSVQKNDENKQNICQNLHQPEKPKNKDHKKVLQDKN